jgi:hypothetical protein
MAVTTNSQTLLDGERIAIMKFYFTTTDTTGETNVVKVNPASLNPSNAGYACNQVSILKVHALTHGLEVQMSWDATTPVAIETIPQNTQYSMDYSAFGGLVNNSGAGKTGKILFTTLDQSAGDSYTVTLELQKFYASP